MLCRFGGGGQVSHWILKRLTRVIISNGEGDSRGKVMRTHREEASGCPGEKVSSGQAPLTLAFPLGKPPSRRAQLQAFPPSHSTSLGIPSLLLPGDSLPPSVLQASPPRGKLQGARAESKSAGHVGNGWFREEKKKLELESQDLLLSLDRGLKEDSRKLALGLGRLFV